MNLLKLLWSFLWHADGWLNIYKDRSGWTESIEDEPADTEVFDPKPSNRTMWGD